jgi:DNA-binding transcriptional ArsR family regulator
MAEKKTIAVAADPAFLEELSEYLDVLSNPSRLQILKLIEREPTELSEIALHIGSTYANAKKHIDRLIAASLVKREAGFGRETSKGIYPVWKYSLTDGSLETLIKNLGIFSNISIPMGYGDIDARIKSVRSAVLATSGDTGPVLYLIEGIGNGHAYALNKDRILVGRVDPDHPSPAKDGDIVLPEDYRAVTRITKPHAFITRAAGAWQIYDNDSTGGTYVNSQRIPPHKRTEISNGDVIDLAIGAFSARFLFVASE